MLRVGAALPQADPAPRESRMRRPFAPAVAVPARDEAARLPRLIEALGRQTWLADEGEISRGVSGRVLPVTIVLNNCRDGSAEAARLAGARHSRLRLDLVEIDFPEPQAHVGSARRLAMARALAAAGPAAAGPAVDAVVLTTDADAVPAPDWIDANLRALGAGADLVGGLIVGDQDEEALLGEGFARRARRQARHAFLADRLTALIDPLSFDPWPRHHDHTGASLAVRGSVYEAVGGLPALPFREDLGFIARARAGGFRLRHDPAVRVGVSARLEGRAPGGMADTLRAWVEAERDGVPQLGEAPEAIEARALLRAALRGLDLEDRGARAFVARSFGIDAARLEGAARAGLNAVALVEALAPDEPDAAATVPVDRAIARLEEMIGEREGRLAAE